MNFFNFINKKFFLKKKTKTDIIQKTQRNLFDT